jgi:hypothetical protein
MTSKYSKLPIDILIKKFLANVKQFEYDHDYIKEHDPECKFLILYSRDLFKNKEYNDKDILLSEITSIENLLLTSKKIKLDIDEKKQKEEEAAELEFIELTKVIEVIHPTIISDIDFLNLKRSFFSLLKDEDDNCAFNNVNEQFEHTINSFDNLAFYFGEYNYEGEMDGKPEFIQNNTLKSTFGSIVTDHVKYLFAKFNLYRYQNKCKYPSMWIVNSIDSIEDILGHDASYFTFTKVELNDKDSRNSFIKNFEKKLNPIVEDNIIQDTIVYNIDSKNTINAEIVSYDIIDDNYYEDIINEDIINENIINDNIINDDTINVIDVGYSIFYNEGSDPDYPNLVTEFYAH